jgi:hypothetical protein
MRSSEGNPYQGRSGRDRETRIAITEATDGKFVMNGCGALVGGCFFIATIACEAKRVPVECTREFVDVGIRTKQYRRVTVGQRDLHQQGDGREYPAETVRCAPVQPAAPE